MSDGTTTHLTRHLGLCPVKKEKLNAGMRLKQQILSFTDASSTDDSSSIANFSYDHATVRELAAHMTFAHEYSFNRMEHVVFNKFLKAISPFYTKIGRNMVRQDYFMTYESLRKKLKNELKGIRRISITTDLWKSGQKIQYMVVTGHYVDISSWELKKCVMNFCNVPPHILEL